MKRWFVLLVCACMLLGLSGCAGQENPLSRAEATPLPGVEERLHAASPAQENYTIHQATLYFRFLDGDSLAGEQRQIVVKKDESYELALLRALVEGPSAAATELNRLIDGGVTVKEVSPGGDMLFVTLSEDFLLDGIPSNWQNQEKWQQEAPLRRALTLQSIVCTVTENLPYSSVQLLILSPEQGSLRLDRSYLLTGEKGPHDPLVRQEEYLLTHAGLARRVLDAWQSRDFARLYSYTASYSHQRPVYEDFAARLDQSPALSAYAISSGSVSPDGQRAVITLQLSLTGEEGSVETAAYPLHLVLDNGIWKITWDSLCHLMLP